MLNPAMELTEPNAPATKADILALFNALAQMEPSVLGSQADAIGRTRLVAVLNQRQ